MDEELTLAGEEDQDEEEGPWKHNQNDGSLADVLEDKIRWLERKCWGTDNRDSGYFDLRIAEAYYKSLDLGLGLVKALKENPCLLVRFHTEVVKRCRFSSRLPLVGRDVV